MVNWTRVYGSAGLFASSSVVVGLEALAISRSGGLDAFNPEYLSASLGSMPLAYGFDALYAAAMAGSIYGIALSGRILYREISGAVKNYRARRAARNTKSAESARSALQKDVAKNNLIPYAHASVEIPKENFSSAGTGLLHFPKPDYGETHHHTLEEDF